MFFSHFCYHLFFLLFFFFFLLFFFFFFFFFQAEDGIRDRDVTGVQTCALPIFASSSTGGSKAGSGSGRGSMRLLIGWSGRVLEHRHSRDQGKPGESSYPIRSEERRVGKECRSRWWTYH